MIWLKAIALQYHSTESYFWIILSLSGYLFCLFFNEMILKTDEFIYKKKGEQANLKFPKYMQEASM